ncbi:MAG: hypothetical protein N3D15_07010 [Syntrophorhabdaceae bacterium]|nr:hypothetical protein [Syntrophorhabdaceae bacterium]
MSAIEIFPVAACHFDNCPRPIKGELNILPVGTMDEPLHKKTIIIKPVRKKTTKEITFFP